VIILIYINWGGAVCVEEDGRMMADSSMVFLQRAASSVLCVQGEDAEK
jgi:hypothetical protein